MLAWATCFERGEIVHEWPTDHFRGKLTNGSRHVQWGQESTRFIDLALVGFESFACGGTGKSCERGCWHGQFGDGTVQSLSALPGFCRSCGVPESQGSWQMAGGRACGLLKIRGPFGGPYNQWKL